MAENKNSFLLYTDLIHTLEKLPREKAGDLFIHILRYVNDKNPVTDDLVIEIAFEPIKQQLKRDLVKYEEIRSAKVEAGKLGGIKSGEARKKQKEANEANASIIKQTQANEPVNVSVYVNDSVNTHIAAVFLDLGILNGQQNYFTMIVVEMNTVWAKHKPEYSFMKDVDYPALLRIAYLISERKKIKKSEITDIKENEVVKAFDKIAAFVSTTQDKFYKRLTLDGIAIAKNFQKIEEAMREQKQEANPPALEHSRITPENYFKD